MRILQVIPSLNPAHGGVAEAVVRVSTGLVRLGHHVDVVTTDRSDERWEIPSDLIVHRVGRATDRYAFSTQLLAWLRRYSGGFDIVVGNSLWNYSSVATRAGCVPSGTPYVIFPHGMLSPWFRRTYPLKHAVKQMYWWLLEGRVAADAQVMIFTAEEERRIARGTFNGFRYRDAVAELGIEEPPAISPDEVSRFRGRVGVGDRRYLLFLGRLHPVKGCDLLIAAFADLAAAYPNIDLLVAGPDPQGLSHRLRAQAEAAGVSDRVHLPGMLTGSDKWSAIRSAEALVLPSHQENFGIVVVEAIACGLPVLMTDKVNIWPAIAPSGAALVGQDTSADVRRMIAAFLSLQRKDREGMARAARACFTERFTAERAAARIAALLEVYRRPPTTLCATSVDNRPSNKLRRVEHC